MKHKYLRMIVCMTLVITMLVGSCPVASARSSTIKLLKVTADGARLREGGSSDYDVITTLKKGTKVFYYGKNSNYFCYVCTSDGKTGYVYKGYLSSYGTVRTDQIYYTTKKATIYKKASTSSSKVTTIAKNRFVIILKKVGNWGYVQTLDGKSGFVLLSYFESV